MEWDAAHGKRAGCPAEAEVNMREPTLWYWMDTFTYTGISCGWMVATVSQFSGVPYKKKDGSQIEHASSVAASLWMIPDLRPMDFWPELGPVVEWADGDMKSEVDAPWDAATFNLASDRLRAFFERVAPGQIEFLPVQMRGHGWEKLKQRYWVMHLQYHWDCIDEAESLWSDPDEETGERSIMWRVIDPARIPPGQLLGLVQNTLVCHRSIKRAYESEGLTGFTFDKMPVVKSVKPAGARRRPRRHDDGRG